jgi:hypothetical protein
LPAHSFTLDEARPLIHFANERHAIYLRKAAITDNEPPSWADPQGWFGDECGEDISRYGKLTLDPILRQYRFCNVFRELDRVTVWIRQHIREPFWEDADLWFMLAVARFINWPPTLEYLIEHSHSAGTWPSSRSFTLGNMTSALEQWKRSGNKVETGAYMIRAESDPKKEWYSWSKQRYISEIVLGRPWEMRDVVSEFLDHTGPTLQETWLFLTNARDEADWVGWGPFMAGQIVADLRHTRYLCNAKDVGRWAPLGPGSTRGLNRLAGRDLKAPLRQEQGLDEMLQLQELVNTNTEPHVPQIELHDIQNCLCETDKYLRAQLGQGRPRAQYIPGRGY